MVRFESRGYLACSPVVFSKNIFSKISLVLVHKKAIYLAIRIIYMKIKKITNGHKHHQESFIGNSLGDKILTSPANGPLVTSCCENS